MYNLTERKLRIGIFSGIFLIFICFIRALYEYTGIENISYIYIKQAVLVTTNAFLYLILLILLYRIVVVYYNQNQIKNLWKWLIKLEVISSISAITTSLITFYGVVSILIVTKLIAVVLYFILFSKINKIDKEELPDIAYLQDSIISFYIVLILLIINAVFLEFGKMKGLNFPDILAPIGQILIAIPILFFIRFLMKIRKRVYKNKITDS